MRGVKRAAAGASRGVAWQVGPRISCWLRRKGYACARADLQQRSCGAAACSLHLQRVPTRNPGSAWSTVADGSASAAASDGGKGAAGVHAWMCGYRVEDTRIIALRRRVLRVAGAIHYRRGLVLGSLPSIYDPIRKDCREGRPGHGTYCGRHGPPRRGLGAGMTPTGRTCCGGESWSGREGHGHLQHSFQQRRLQPGPAAAGKLLHSLRVSELGQRSRTTCSRREWQVQTRSKR
jgi:hypothetical protein